MAEEHKHRDESILPRFSIERGDIEGYEGLLNEVLEPKIKDVERITTEILGYVLKKYDNESSLLKFENYIDQTIREIFDLLDRRDYRSLYRQFGIPPRLFRIGYASLFDHKQA